MGLYVMDYHGIYFGLYIILMLNIISRKLTNPNGKVIVV